MCHLTFEDRVRQTSYHHWTAPFCVTGERTINQGNVTLTCHTARHNTAQHKTIQHTTPHQTTVQYNTIHTIQYKSTQYNTAQYNTVQRNTTKHNTKGTATNKHQQKKQIFHSASNLVLSLLLNFVYPRSSHFIHFL